MGLAVPQVIGRHAHPKAKPEQPTPVPSAPSGIDYLQLLADQHHHALARRINYDALTDPGRHGNDTGEHAGDAARGQAGDAGREVAR